MADGGPKDRVDPAYDAHKLPIGEWAFAVWEGHMAIASMNCTVQFAKKKMRKATNLEMLLRTGGCVCVELLAAGVEGA